MSEIEFNYEGTQIIVQCNSEEKMGEIIDRFVSKAVKKKEELYFIYSGQMVDENKTFISQVNEIDKQRNKMSILVNNKNDANSEEDEESLRKSKYIICPTCQEKARILVKNYKLGFYDCKNGHRIKDLPISDYESTQNIDESKIKCQNCLKNNKSTSYNHIFFICFDCKKNLCNLCKSIHDKTHNIIDYDEKFFTCDEHYENYISYCNNCKKDICVTCEMEHKEHNIITYGSILPNIKKIKEDINNFNSHREKLKKDIQDIINKLNIVLKTLNEYFSIYEDIINSYEVKKRNYFLLQNIHDITKFNESIIKDIDQITNEKNISNKIDFIFKIYDNLNIKENNKDTENINDNNKINDFNKLLKDYKNINEKELLIKEENNNIINDKTKGEKSDENIKEENNIKNDSGVKKNNTNEIVVIDKELMDNYEKIEDNNYKDFDVSKTKNFLSIETKINIKSVFVLKDGRIIAFNDEEKNFICLVFDLKNKISFDIKLDKITNIFQMEDGIVFITTTSKIMLLDIKEKEFEIVYSLEIESLNEDKNEEMKNFAFFKLSNEKIILLIYKYIYKNKILNKLNYTIFESYLFDYKNQKLTLEKSSKLNSTKNIYFDEKDKLMIINDKEIVMTYFESGMFFHSFYLMFLDLEKDKKIESIKLTNSEYFHSILCPINKDIFIFTGDNKLYPIHLRNHRRKKEFCLDGHESINSAFSLNDKQFMVASTKYIYHLELKQDNKLNQIQKIELSNSKIIKYRKNSLIILRNYSNVNSTINLYG